MSRGRHSPMSANDTNRFSTALHRIPERSAAQKLRDDVLDIAEEVFDRYVYGESFQAIADSLPFKIAGWRLREILMESEETRETYARASTLRSHNLVDAAVEFGYKAAKVGDAAGLRVAVDTCLKVAGKLNAAYNDKASLELTGKDGGPVKVEADLSLTAEQAYERLIKGE